MGRARRDVLTFAPRSRGAAAAVLAMYSFPPLVQVASWGRYFFLPAIGRAGPLRVRAFVWVRWPRTGSPLRWRNPR